MRRTRLLASASILTDRGVTLFLNYFICKNKQTAMWSVMVEKREMVGGEIAVTELAYADCGRFKRDAAAIARKLAEGEVTPVALDDVVRDLRARFGFTHRLEYGGKNDGEEHERAI